MKRFLLWCLAVSVLSLSGWTLGSLLIRKVLTDANEEAIAVVAQTLTVEESYFSENALFFITFIVFFLLSISLSGVIASSSLYKQLREKISDNLSSASVTNDSLPSLLSNLVLLAGSCFVLLFIVNLLLGLMGMQAQMGVFGDFIGGLLNPTLSFISFVALLLTIVIQSKELQETRIEIKNSSLAQNKAEKALNQQAFESTYFSMLNQQNDITKSVEIDFVKLDSSCIKVENHLASINRKKSFLSELGVSTGRQAFSSIAEWLKYANDEGFDGYVKRYGIIQNQRNDLLGHYFRNLFQVIKFVDEYNEEYLNFDDKYKYLKILRAQISYQELVILYFNCLKGVVDQGEFQQLITKYHLLKHLSIDTNSTETTQLNEPIVIGDKMSVSLDSFEQYIDDEENTSAFGDSIGFQKINDLVIKPTTERTNY